jgi:diketogulonate reductase-like aldo/keto reductase
VNRRALLGGLAALAACGTSSSASATVTATAKTGAAMLTRAIASSGERLPVIGLGTWSTFDVGGSARERDPLREVLRGFAGAGSKVIDSSPMYGRAEAVAGELLGELGISAFVATKVWTRGKERGIAEMERSIALLGHVDLMQVHNLLDVQTHLATLRAWKAEGRVRYIGVTHYQLGAFDELEKLLREVDFVQLPYSVRVREAEKRLLPAAADAGCAVLVMRPFEEGALFDAVKGKPLPPFAAEIDCTSWAQLFLKWILGDARVTCPIPATANPKHLADNIRAGFGKLPDASHRKQLVTLLGG